MKRLTMFCILVFLFMVSPITAVTANQDPNKGFDNNTTMMNNISNQTDVFKIDGSLIDLFEQYNNSDIYMDNAAVGPTGEQIRFLDIGNAGKPQNVSPINPLEIGLSHYSRF